MVLSLFRDETASPLACYGALYNVSFLLSSTLQTGSFFLRLHWPAVIQEFAISWTLSSAMERILARVHAYARAAQHLRTTEGIASP